MSQLTNPLMDQIEQINERMIGELTYHGKPVVLLEHAIEALENLEAKMTEGCQDRVTIASRGMINNY